jgi:hypothetical protein
LTLIDKKDGKQQAEGNVGGAILGSASLALFGLVSYVLLDHTNPVLAELGAALAWLAGATALYLVARTALRQIQWP